MKELESGTHLTEDAEDAVMAESLRQGRPREAARGSLERDVSIALILATASNKTDTETKGQKLGRLLVRSRIGGGAMGVVYEAYDPKLRRSVAVKLLRGHVPGDQRELVAAEAGILAQVNHPNVVPIYEIVDTHKELYFVMERVQGVTLEEWLEAHPDASWREIVALFVQAGRGLDAAHKSGIVHGDFKPRNALVGDDGRVRVVDFGFASLHGEALQRGGTVDLMAPETRAGARATALSDQYSFCLALQSALAGQPLPESVSRLLRRGCREHADARHPDFQTLLDGLDAERSSQRDRSHALLLERVERIWLTGVLYRSLAGHASESLSLRPRPELIDSPWATWSHRPRISEERGTHAAYPSEDIADLLGHSYNALLLVGEPGSGKTTLLLELCKDLWRAASASDDAPRPVVLNISSFQATSQSSNAEGLANWVVDEVVAKYSIPRATIRKALENASVALLLDGLDEAPAQQRTFIVEAINAFRDTYPVPLVVSCRDTEYASIGKKLRFGGAVQLEPLDDDAVVELSHKRGAKNFIREGQPIPQVFRNPLLLTLCTRGADTDHVGAVPDWKRVYQQVVAASLRRAHEGENPTQLEAQLRFLASTMKRLGTTDLWLEQVNFSWIKGRSQRLAVYVVGVLAVLLFGVGLNLAHVPFTRGPFAMALTFGLGVSILSFAYTRGRIKPVERLRWSWKRALRLLPVTTACASLVGLAQALQINFAANMAGAAITGVILAFSFALEPGEQASKVRPNIGIRRSLAHATTLAFAFGLPVGLLFGLVINPYITRPLAEHLVYEGHHGLIVGCSVGLFVFTTMFLVYGGFTVIMHTVLRFWLAWTSPLPLRLVPTLDRFVELDLMRRVGGGYVFLHRTLLDYLASDGPDSDALGADARATDGAGPARTG